MTEYVLVGTPDGRIGCALIQAMFGGTVPSDKLARMPWVIDSIEGMQPYRITAEQLDALIGSQQDKITLSGDRNGGEND